MLHNSNNVDNNKNANNSTDPLAFNATPNNFDWSAQLVTLPKQTP